MKKKSRRPAVDLDLLAKEKNLKVTAIDEVETNELRGDIPVEERPISEIALKVAVDLKRGEKWQIRVASTNMVLSMRRLMMDELERIVRGSNLVAHCVEEDTLLTFSYVKRY